MPNMRKKQQPVNENSPIIQAFRVYQTELDAKHDRYERIVKLSRDITIESKRSIFLLQRAAGYVFHYHLNKKLSTLGLVLSHNSMRQTSK